MKKNTVYLLLAILIISQVLSFLKINNMQRQIENTTAELDQLSYSISSSLDSIYSNVDEMLKQKASIIESATAEMGAIDEDEVTVPITYTLTPKEISPHTAVSLDFDGELFPMEKKGTAFHITVSRNIFVDTTPKIVINENGVKKITQDDRIGIWNIKESIFPTFYLRFEGEESYHNNIFKKKGHLIADSEGEMAEITFTYIRLVVKVDDEVISKKKISYKTLSNGYEMEEEIPLNDGQEYTMTIIAKDSIGFEHHFIVDQWVAGTDSQKEPIEHEQIYSADGKLLWDSHHE